MPTGIRLLVSSFALAVCLAWPALARGQSEEAAIIQARVGQLRNGAEVRIGAASIASTVVLPEFYERREFRPAWTDPANVDALIESVRGSLADGLNPEDYHLAALDALRAAPQGAERDADLDLLATDALIRLGYHLRFGKVDMLSIDPHWNFLQDYDAVLATSPATTIQDALDNRRVSERLEALRPTHPLYAGLRRALAAYREIQAAGGWKPIPSGRSIRPGEVDPRVPELRERLAVEGDSTDSAEQSAVYDETLIAAVRRFQERHGLNPDGIVGRRTVRALNVPVEHRIDQLRLSLERGRLLLRDLPERYVMVNVPAFRITYTDESGQRFVAKVVVGKTVAKTPIFRAEMTHVVLNPTWVIPPVVLREEIFPALRKDPDYLSKKGLRRVGGQIVQDPGPNNALGRIKLMLPNPHMVYLHDTPRQDLFESEERTFSHGCIRVQNVFELAALALDEPQLWSKEKLLAAADTGRTQTILLRRKVPVLFTYWTAAVDPDERVVFFEDVYERDAAELAALDAPFAFPRWVVTRAAERTRR
jgi:murein L,D-transpeptidase YcbB/YkuD